MDNPLQIYNSLTQNKEPLTPLEPGHVKIYACGVTTYDHCHIGHAMQAVLFDIIRRYLLATGLEVTYVRNYTDVDDKIIARAAERGVSPRDLAEEMMASEQADMKALGLMPPTHEPKVSENIPEIIAFVEKLIAADAAYATSDGDVYYRVRSKADYGKLSNRRPDDLRAGTRDIHQGSKEDPLDFALWKRDETVDASWASPWGPGRPGWHIECSVMAHRYLGARFDIHGGGRDLIFPHHENEIAQSESALGPGYATVWMHSGLLTIEQQKMSKSLGNAIPIRDFLLRWDAEVLRLAYAQNHYRSNVDFSEAVFRSCQRRLLCFYEALRLADELPESVAGSVSPEAQGHVDGFHRAMRDDFNTPAALAELHGLVRLVNLGLEKKKGWPQARGAAQELKRLAATIGLLAQEPAAFCLWTRERMLPELGVTRQEIDRLIAARSDHRAAREWAESDRIRDELIGKGIELRDTAVGTEWRICLSED